MSFEIGDRVRIKTAYLYAMRSYQFKALGYRRLVGVVRKTFGDMVDVDFCQHDMPVTKDGSLVGARVRVTVSIVGSSPYFPCSMLEKVK